MKEFLLLFLFLLSFCGLIWSISMMFRNLEVADFYRRMLHEEGEWLQDHSDYFARSNGRFLRYESLPPYHLALYKFWIPLENYEKPLFDFYRDLPPVQLADPLGPDATQHDNQN